MSDHGPYSGVVDIARNGIDEVIRLKAQAKQDKALIRQMLEALELPTMKTKAILIQEYQAITAARARLGEKT